MIARHGYLSQHPDVFRGLTGPRLAEFDALAAELLPRFAAEEHARRDRPNRRRATGGGRAFGLAVRDQLLCALVWPRTSPTYPVLAYLFGGDDATVRRHAPRWLRLPEDVAYNRASARRRAPAEHPIGQPRQFQALSQPDRHHRQHHTARARAVAGPVNHRRRQRAAA